MRYIASVDDFFKNPKWLPNLLLVGVCMLIPIAGPLAVMGWSIGGLYGRSNPWEMATFPEFNFNNFGKYLERGVWPFLVQLVASLVFIPLMWVVMAVPMLIMGALISGSSGEGGQHAEPAGLAVAAMLVVTFTGYMIVMTLMVLVIKPMMLRSVITQDFGAAFDFRFMKRFIALTWKEQILATLFLMVAGMLLVFLGAIALCVGMYAAVGLVMFSSYHMDRQLYELYLARGGEPVPLSPKLSGMPPPLPG
ncbi:MAG: DUF4013 domain-containing protein [Prosthecobacter sp.]